MSLFIALLFGGAFLLAIGLEYASTVVTLTGAVMLALVIIPLILVIRDNRRKRLVEEQEQKALESQKREAEQRQRLETQARLEAAYKESQRRAEHKRAREALIAAKRAEVSDLLENLPQAEIKVDVNAVALPEPDYSDISVNRITSRSNLYTLGRFVAIDVETTGLSPIKNDIVEVAAIRFEDYVPVSVFHTLCKPPRGIQAKAREINGITDQMVADKPTFTQVAQSLCDFIGKYPLVGHNLTFDLQFIRNGGCALSSAKKFDTLALVRAARIEELFSNRLTDVCNYFDIFVPQAHSAVSDAYATAMVYINMVSYHLPVFDYIAQATASDQQDDASADDLLPTS